MSPACGAPVELEGRPAGVPVAFWPSMQRAMVLGWVGQLESAREQMASIREDCLKRGRETAVVYVAFYLVHIDIWWGNLTGATAVAQDAMERALQARWRRLAQRCPGDAGQPSRPTPVTSIRPAMMPRRRSPLAGGSAPPLMDGWVSADSGFH